MKIKSTANYPIDEILSLMEFVACRSKADLSRVQVNIKNNRRGAVAGRAYNGVPIISNAIKEADRLVTLRIGSPGYFPSDNMTYEFKWRKYRGKRWQVRTPKHPYGGKSSPHIVYETWKEGLIATAAHEFQHIYQYQNNLPSSEIECEKTALDVLERYRGSYSSND